MILSSGHYQLSLAGEKQTLSCHRPRIFLCLNSQLRDGSLNSLLKFMFLKISERRLASPSTACTEVNCSLASRAARLLRLVLVSVWIEASVCNTPVLGEQPWQEGKWVRPGGRLSEQVWGRGNTRREHRKSWVYSPKVLTTL